MNLFSPMVETFLVESLSLFSKVSVVVSGFVGVVFVMRAVFLHVRVSSNSEYGELLTDCVSYFGLITVYPMMVRLLVNSISQIAMKIEAPLGAPTNSSSYETLKDLLGDYAIVEFLSKAGDVAILALSQSIYSILIGLLIAIAPIVIFSSTVLKISNGVREYFQILMAMSLWPVLWNILGSLGFSFAKHFSVSPFRTLVFSVVVYMLQLLSPIFCMLLFKSMSSAGVLAKVVKLGR